VSKFKTFLFLEGRLSFFFTHILELEVAAANIKKLISLLFGRQKIVTVLASAQNFAIMSK
jgi:hypothetical protein